MASPNARLSWRDPDGFVIKTDGRILRAVALAKAERTQALLGGAWIRQLIDAGSIAETKQLGMPPANIECAEKWLWLEHRPLSFPVYPHEMTALQLFDSAALTLDIAVKAAQNGWVLKDASAWNVLYDYSRPVFVDLLSFDRTDSQGRWLAYGQFVRHFLLPLLLFQKLGMTPVDIFSIHREGVTPERAQQLLGPGKLLSLTGLELVVLPNWLARSGSELIAADSKRKPRVLQPDVAASVLLSTLVRLRKVLNRLLPPLTGDGTASVWEGYEEGRDHYSNADLAAKRDFVAGSVGDCRTVLDLGCNAGEFSLLAAAGERSVVAADADHAALSRLYSRIRFQATGVTPIILNIGRPTPAVGWLNTETPSFLDRSAGYFDCVMMLGLIHHLLVGERMMLPMLVDLLARLDPKKIILEWIDPSDRKFRQLAGLNQSLYSYLNVSELEMAMSKQFLLVEKLSLPCGTRFMYLWSR